MATTESKRERNDTAPVECKWTGCPQKDIAFDTPDELAIHVDKCHMAPCAGMDLFFCLWEGCKVYNKASYSYGWLQRHVKEKHTKERPNKCIMNGCNMSFNTAEALQRHILRHFDRSPSPPTPKTTLRGNKSTATTLTVSTTSKHPNGVSLRGNGIAEPEEYDEAGSSDGRKINGSFKYKQKKYSLKVRIPRHSLRLSAPYQPAPYNGAHFHTEVLDHKTMSVIRQTTNLLAMNDIEHRSQICITTKAEIIGKRKCPCADEEEVLVRWNPRIIPDSWVRLSEYKQEQAIPLGRLSDKQLSLLSLNCFGHDKLQNRKSKRKP